MAWTVADCAALLAVIAGHDPDDPASDARTTLTLGSTNTLPLEIYALISSDSTPTLFAIGTVTTAVSFQLIGLTLAFVLRLQRRRGPV